MLMGMITLRGSEYEYLLVVELSGIRSLMKFPEAAYCLGPSTNIHWDCEYVEV